ncbi:hypothetical protein MKX03_010060, partial [Papaver bracteatum]
MFLFSNNPSKTKRRTRNPPFQRSKKLQFLQRDLTMPRGRDPMKVQYILMLRWSVTRPSSSRIYKIQRLINMLN